MKRDMNQLDLQAAFSPMPDDCKDALMTAARSVKEEKQVKRASFRAVPVAALIVVVTMAVAFAATQLGWVDFYKQYDGVTVPKAGEEILNATKPQTYQVGPMTFTFKQLMADGRIALSMAQIHTTDGAKVLYAPDSDIYDAVDAGVDTVRKLYGLAQGTTWVDAAKQLNLPLYGVRALIEVSDELSGGEAMEDALFDQDGSILYFNMPSTNINTVEDSLPVTLYMAVTEFDPLTGEEKEKWRDRQETTISVSGMIAEKTFKPEENATIAGMTLKEVHAQQYPTGVYLFTTCVAPEGMTRDAAVDALYSLSTLNSNGDSFPGGINLSGSVNLDAFPTVVLETMISVENLPESIVISDDTTKITVK